MSVDPFDIKTLLLVKHAQHVVLIHCPIAVFAVAVAFDYCAHWTNNRPLAAGAYFNLLLARCQSWPRVLSRGSWPSRDRNSKGFC
jgi:uncharacterized membrane protein